MTAAERDGYADGSRNEVWRAARHPVSARLDYERGFQRGQRDGRTARMLEMRRKGATLQEIGDQFDLTRERIRQILRDAGGAPRVTVTCTSTTAGRPYGRRVAAVSGRDGNR